MTESFNERFDEVYKKFENDDMNSKSPEDNNWIADLKNVVAKIMREDFYIPAAASQRDKVLARLALDVLQKYKKGSVKGFTDLHLDDSTLKGSKEFLEGKTVVWIQKQNGVKEFYTLDAFDFKTGINPKNMLDTNDMYSDAEAPDIDWDQFSGISGIGVKTFGRASGGKPTHLEGGRMVQIRGLPQGSFWQYTTNIPIDLSVYQIFDKVDKKNYKHNCFVYACIQSGVFTDEEIESMCRMIKTRSFPRRNVKLIAKEFKVNFIVRHVDRYDETRVRCDCDTRKILKETYDRTVEMILYHEHYLLRKDLNITEFYIQNAEMINEKFKDIPQEKRWTIKKIVKDKPVFSSSLRTPGAVIRDMFKYNRFTPITSQDQALLRTSEYNETINEYEDLNYDVEHCVRKIEDKRVKQEYEYIVYADFESDPTVKPHKAYLCCVVWMDKESGKPYEKTFRGYDCAKKFLQWLPFRTLVYFHNLKYDASFFMNISRGYAVNIMEHGGAIKQIVFTHKKSAGRITFRDSYSLIPKPLKSFGSMFNLETEKEVMIYELYTEENLKRELVTLDECAEQLIKEYTEAGKEKEIESAYNQFLLNCKKCGCLHADDEVDIMQYAEFYCLRDCLVLMLGMRKFDNDLMQVFASNDREWIGLQSYLSISAIGYDFACKYGCMEGCYEIAGKPQEFISRCITGGRTMTAGNKKQIITDNIQDFDAVSLYPSAMYTMPGIAKGIPKVLSEEECKNKTFKDYDNYFLEINITKLTPPVDYKFPLVFVQEGDAKMFRNKCVEHFYVDKRSLEDLEEFYNIEYDVLRGYYFNEGFNPTIKKFIKTVFDLRAKYKAEGNPLQETIKLLLNSIYGKSILKPIDTETAVVDVDKVDSFMIKNYNFLKSLTVDTEHNHAYAKKIKPVNNHFNCPQFGVSVLSWSKHLMNRVMCLAEQKRIPIFYQDTDSMHLLEDDVEELAYHFQEKYGQELIGSNLTQFHCDFDRVNDKPTHSVKLIALGKKSYLDILENTDGERDYHIRMKGIPKQVILNYCQKKGITVEELYERLYEGEEVTFDLMDGAKCFRKNKFYEQFTPEEFKRKIQFK